MRTIKIQGAAQQRGATLVMALVVLVLLTILALSAMKGSTLEYRDVHLCSLALWSCFPER